MKKPVCPACKSQFNLRYLYGYSTLLGMRRSQPCPNCGAMLRWTQKPFMLMNLGSAVLIAAAASVFIFSERLFDAWNTPTILFAVGAATTLISLFLLRLEETNSFS